MGQKTGESKIDGLSWCSVTDQGASIEVSVTELRETCERALVAHGAGEWQAREVAKALTRSEQTGNTLCGVQCLEDHCRQLRSGRVNGLIDPVVVKRNKCQVCVDAKGGFAEAAFSRALPKALRTAENLGLSSIAVSYSHNCLSLGYFTEQIASNGLIGIGFANAQARVVPPEGNTPVLGTNPIAFTLPGESTPYLHADFATSAVALGTVKDARTKGEGLPAGWAIDSEGLPTNDPNAALKGALLPAAGHKGWALGLLAEALAAGLTGSSASVDVGDLAEVEGPPHDLGQFYLLIDPGARENEFRAQAFYSQAAAGARPLLLLRQRRIHGDLVLREDQALHRLVA